MKKLYTLSLAALTALSSLAATPKVTESPAKQINGRISAIENKLTCKEFDKTELNRRAVKRSVSASDVTGKYDITLGDWYRNGGAGEYTTTSEITVAADGSVELTCADFWNKVPFYGQFDATASTITFKKTYLGNVTLQGGAVAQAYSEPMYWDGVAQKIVRESYSVTVADDGSITFPADHGVSFTAYQNGTYLGNFQTLDIVSLTPNLFDYSLSVETSGECAPDNKFYFTVKPGADIKTIKAITIAGDLEGADAVGYYETMGQEIAPNTEYVLDLDGKLAKTGPYSVLVAGYNEAGEEVKYAEAGFIVTVAENDKYQTIATVPYNNEFVGAYYTFSFVNEAMELQESVETPGKYRLLNPHAGHTYLHADGCDHYIYLDASDAEAVAMEYSPTGLDWGDGHLVLGTFNGALGYTNEECATNGFAVPVLNGRDIVFPVGSLLAHEVLWNGAGSWSYVNTQEGSEITYSLPDLCLNVTVVDNKGKAVEGAEVAVGDVKAATDAEGVAKLVLPASVDYLDTVEVSAKLESESYDNVLDAKKEVKLNGANNEYTFATDLSGVAAIEAAAADGEVEYFNLQGVRIANPAKGQVVIARQGSKVSKQLVK